MYLHKAFIGILASSCAFSGVNARIRHEGKHEESIKASTSPRTPAEMAVFEEMIVNRIPLATPGSPPAMPPGKAEEKSLVHVDMGPSTCTDSNAWCTYWANRGECVINSGYMLTSCCSSCSQFECRDDTHRAQPEFFPVCPGTPTGNYCDGTGDCTNNPTWCSCGVGQSFCQSNVNPCPPTIGYYDDLDWAEMPDRIQDAWAGLGWSQQLWDNDGTAWSNGWAWDDLDYVAQNHAIVLGYNDWSWDGNSSLREIAEE